MAKNNSDDDDFDEDDDGEMLDDFDIVDLVENKLISSQDSSDARRRLENLIEEKALQRLLSGDLDDWDDGWDSDWD